MNMKSMVLSTAMVLAMTGAAPAAALIGPLDGTDIVSHSGSTDEKSCHRARKRNGWHCHEDN